MLCKEFNIFQAVEEAKKGCIMRCPYFGETCGYRFKYDLFKRKPQWIGINKEFNINILNDTKWIIDHDMN